MQVEVAVEVFCEREKNFIGACGVRVEMRAAADEVSTIVACSLSKKATWFSLLSREWPLHKSAYF